MKALAQMTLAALAISACSGESLTGPTSRPPESPPNAPTSAGTYSVEVVVATSGLPADPDGYVVTLDGRESRSVGPNGSVIFEPVAGAEHEVELSGVADNCSVEGDAERTLVINGTRGWLEFEVLCTGLFHLGDRIVFTSRARDYGEEIWAMKSDGSNPSRVTLVRQRSDFAAVSPDGSRIAYASTGDDPFGRWALFLMNADGSGNEQLTPFSDEIAGSWSPDGAWIAFASGRHGGSGGMTFDAGGQSSSGNFEIYMIRADGSEERRLTDDPGQDLYPAWSPDGEHIAFSTDREGNFEIYLLRLSDGALQNLTAHPGFDDQPSWSPDGSRIAFTSRRDGSDDIYVMNRDGTGVRKLTDSPASDVRPSWSADWRQLLFSSDRDGSYQLFAVNADDGNGVVGLTDGSRESLNGEWGP